MANSSLSITPTVGDGQVTFKIDFNEESDFKADKISSVNIIYTNATSNYNTYNVTEPQISTFKTDKSAFITISGLTNGIEENYTLEVYGIKTNGLGIHLKSPTVKAKPISKPSAVFINKDVSTATGNDSFVVNIRPCENNGGASIQTITAYYTYIRGYTVGTGVFIEPNNMSIRDFDYTSLTALADGTFNLRFDSSDGIVEHADYELALKFFNGFSDSVLETSSQMVIGTTDQCYKPTSISTNSQNVTTFTSPSNASYLKVTGIRLERKNGGSYSPSDYEYFKHNSNGAFEKIITPTFSSTTGLPIQLGDGNLMTNNTVRTFSFITPTNNVKYTYRMRLLNESSTLNNQNLAEGEIHIGEVSDEFDTVNMADPSEVVIVRDGLNDGYERSEILPTGITNSLNANSLCKIIATNINFSDPLLNWSSPNDATETYRVATISIDATKPALYCATKKWYSSSTASEKSNNTTPDNVFHQENIVNNLKTILGLASGTPLTFSTWNGLTAQQKLAYPSVNGSNANVNAVNEYFNVINTAASCLSASSGANSIQITDTYGDIRSFNLTEQNKAIFAPAGSLVKVEVKPKISVTVGGEVYTREGPTAPIEFIPTSKITDFGLNFTTIPKDQDIALNLTHFNHDHGQAFHSNGITVTITDSSDLSNPYSCFLQPEKDTSSHEFYKPFSLHLSSLRNSSNNAPVLLNGRSYTVELSGSLNVTSGTGGLPNSTGYLAKHYDYGTMSQLVNPVSTSGNIPVGQSGKPNFVINETPRDAQLQIAITPLPNDSTGLNGANFSQYNFYLMKEANYPYATAQSASESALAARITNGVGINGYEELKTSVNNSTINSIEFNGLINGQTYYVIAKTIVQNGTANSNYKVSHTSLLCYGSPSEPGDNNVPSKRPVLSQSNGVLTVTNILPPKNDGVGLTDSNVNVKFFYIKLYTVNGSGNIDGSSEKLFLIPNTNSTSPYYNNTTSYTLTTTFDGTPFIAQLGTTYRALVTVTSTKQDMSVLQQVQYLSSTSPAHTNDLISRVSPQFNSLSLSGKVATINFSANGSVIDSGLLAFTTDVNNGDAFYQIDQSLINSNGTITVNFSNSGPASFWPSGATSITGAIAILTDNTGRIIYGTVGVL